MSQVKKDNHYETVGLDPDNCKQAGNESTQKQPSCGDFPVVAGSEYKVFLRI